MAMYVQKVRKALTVLIVLIFFSNCSELDSVLSSTGTYQVKALVNDVSLDECSIISSGDKIRPYFASSIDNDPDITGLMVYLKNPKGEILGGKIHYTLKPKTDTVLETKTSTGEDKTEEKTEDKTESSKNSGEETEKSETTKLTGAAETSADTIDIDTIVIEDAVIHVKRLDKNLPYFSMPKNLSMGQYTLVFQVIGGKENLGRSERPFYYLDNAKFSLKDIRIYLPGLNAGSRLIPAGATIMLEARLDFDSQLDPYIIWYNGKKVISEGRFSNEAGTILWKAPDQNGFHYLRAEAFPFHTRQGFKGSSREISLPVSSKTTSENLLPGDAPELLHWYQFEGSLKDSKSPMSTEWVLKPKEEKLPGWSPAGSSYGLSAGPGEAYLLPAVSFFREETKGGGRFLFRLKPVADGSVFSARFGISSTESLQMSLNLKEENLILRLNASGVPPVEVSETLSSPESGMYITITIDFFILPEHFGVKLSQGDADQQDVPEKDQMIQNEANWIDLAVSLNGECTFTLGGEMREPLQVPQKETVQLPLVTAVWNELALFYADPPVITAKIEEPDPETEEAVPETVEAAEPELETVSPEQHKLEAESSLREVPPEPKVEVPIPAEEQSSGESEAA
ncbi:hypothetical protein AGMMS50293_23560 [Spirochaetia bacterium]|nr:hypothetical protein AGMMS50293_23560 [Spirochaetia bacterium]